MDAATLTRDEVRQILRASEGIPSPISSARVFGNQVTPARVGHPISNHLHSASLVEGKTKFLSMDDMVEALWQLLRTPTAQAALKNLAVGSRTTIRADVTTLFGFECELGDPQGRPTTHKVKFSPNEQRLAGLTRTSCVAVLENRERAGRVHLQVHTFYPAISPLDASSLLQAVRMQQRR
jgi:hypothetical protein